MPAIARSDTSVLGQGWWTVDRWSLLAVIALAAFGVLLAASASPAVAERLRLEPTYFLKRQAMFLAPAIILMFTVSLFSPVQVRRLGVLLFIFSLALMVLHCSLAQKSRVLDAGLVLLGSHYTHLSLPHPALQSSQPGCLQPANYAEHFPALKLPA